MVSLVSLVPVATLCERIDVGPRPEGLYLLLSMRGLMTPPRAFSFEPPPASAGAAVAAGATEW